MTIVKPRLASTVILLRDIPLNGGGVEVFMVRRVVQSEFMPDVYVFPGGSVIPDDYVLEANDNLCAPVLPSISDPEGHTMLQSGLRAAAIRELFEEGNVLLAYHEGHMLAITEATLTRFSIYRQALNERKAVLSTIIQSEQLTLATDHLIRFAHWITPEGLPKRFDTYFFLAVVPTQQEALYDNLETSAGTWIQPAQAIASFQRGEMPIAFPTLHQLHALSSFNSVQEALTITSTRYEPTRRPAIGQQDGRNYIYLPEEPDKHWPL